MSMYVIAYLENGETRCPRGCCRDDSWYSQFEFKCFNSLEAMYEYIADNIENHQHHSFRHHIFMDESRFVEFSNNTSWPQESIKCIEVVGDLTDFTSEVQEQVGHILSQRQSAKWALEEEKREKEKKEQEQQQLEQQRQQYERLKKKFETV